MDRSALWRWDAVPGMDLGIAQGLWVLQVSALGWPKQQIALKGGIKAPSRSCLAGYPGSGEGQHCQAPSWISLQGRLKSSQILLHAEDPGARLTAEKSGALGEFVPRSWGAQGFQSAGHTAGFDSLPQGLVGHQDINFLLGGWFQQRPA